MRKVLIGTVLAAVGLLFWLMQRSADTDTGRKLPDAGLAKVAVPAPLPGLLGFQRAVIQSVSSFSETDTFRFSHGDISTD